MTTQNTPGTTTAPANKPEPGTQEYNQMMANRFENQSQFELENKLGKSGVETKPVEKKVEAMPEDGVEKFYNKETGDYNWKDHAKELAFKLNQKPEKKEEPKDDDKKSESDQKTSLNWDEIRTKAESKEGLSDDDIKSIVGMGIPEDLVRQYLEAMPLAQEAVLSRTHQYAGGKENLDKAIEWAQKNLPKNEIDGINEILASAAWKSGIDSLMHRYTTRPGANEPTIQGGSNSSGEIPFRDKTQMVAAMSKRDEQGRKLYDIDPEYRDQVAKRIAVSKF